MKRLLFLFVSLVCSVAFAQTPVYLTKAYKPVESDRYDAYSSLEIQGGIPGIIVLLWE